MKKMRRSVDERSVIKIVTYECGEWVGLAKEIEKQMKALPSAEPERESGEWIIADTQNEEDVQNGNYRYICSCCGYSDIHAKAVRVPYCWHCGANMIGEDHENDNTDECI